MTTLRNVPFNDLSRLYRRYASLIEPQVIETLRSGWWIGGNRANNFAEQFSEFIGARKCIPVANGTDALELALRTAAAFAPNKREVVTVANAGGYTTIATYAAGLIPVYADIEESTQLLSFSSALECINDRTLAIVVTHLYGGLANIDELRQALWASEYKNILIIGDCAQAHGAGAPGRRAGYLEDLAAFSFYPTKNLGAMGDAGAILTSSEELAAIASRLHQYGWSSKYTVAQAGGRNSRMDEVQATILSSLLPHLAECNDERAAILARYSQACPHHVRLLERSTGSIIHLAVVMSEQRDSLRTFLGQRGISSDIHYPILDCDQPGWQSSKMRIAPQGIPQSRASSTELLSLPCFVGMTADEIDHVCQALNDFPCQ